MRSLPPILARDYFWNVVWPHVSIVGRSSSVASDSG